MIATIAGGIGSAITGWKALAIAEFFSHMDAWRVSFAIFFVMFCAMGVVWFNEWLNRRFAAVANAFTDVRKEMREGFARQARACEDNQKAVMREIADVKKRVYDLETKARIGKE